jgi:sortase (surface protein transpeptidase)
MTAANTKMFEENLQFNTPNFGVSGHRPLPRPISDIGTRSSSYLDRNLQPEPELSPVKQALPDTAVLPDFLLFPETVKASSLPEYTPWSVRRPFLYIIVVALMLVGIAAALQVVVDRQFAKALSVNPSTNSSTSVSHSYLSAKPSIPAASGAEDESKSPNHLDIEPLNIHAKIVGADFTEKVTLINPISFQDAAWSKSSAKTGSQGTMVIGANANSCVQPSVFNTLKDIALGTSIFVTTNAGEKIDYKVIRSQILDQAKVTLETLSDPPVHYRPGLNIVTCIDNGESGKRLVVNAVLYQ